MEKLNQHRKLAILIIILLIPVFFLVGIVISRTTSSDKNIRDVRLTNVTSNSATITFQSSESFEGQVAYSNENDFPEGIQSIFGNFNGEIAYDDRNLIEVTDIDNPSFGDLVYDSEVAENRTIHHVTLRNLSPETQYYFRIKDQDKYLVGQGFNNNDFFSFVTSETIDETIQQPDPIYGQVVNLDDSEILVDEGIVYYYLENSDGIIVSSLFSTTIDNGTWSGDLTEINQTLDNKGKDNTYLEAEAITEEGVGEMRDPLEQYKPIQSIPINVRYIPADGEIILLNQFENNINLSSTELDKLSDISVSDGAKCGGFAENGSTHCNNGGANPDNKIYRCDNGNWVDTGNSCGGGNNNSNNPSNNQTQQNNTPTPSNSSPPVNNTSSGDSGKSWTCDPNATYNGGANCVDTNGTPRCNSSYIEQCSANSYKKVTCDSGGEFRDFDGCIYDSSGKKKANANSAQEATCRAPFIFINGRCVDTTGDCINKNGAANCPSEDPKAGALESTQAEGNRVVSSENTSASRSGGGGGSVNQGSTSQAAQAQFEADLAEYNECIDTNSDLPPDIIAAECGSEPPTPPSGTMQANAYQECINNAIAADIQATTGISPETHCEGVGGSSGNTTAGLNNSGQVNPACLGLSLNPGEPVPSQCEDVSVGLEASELSLETCTGRSNDGSDITVNVGDPACLLAGTPHFCTSEGFERTGEFGECGQANCNFGPNSNDPRCSPNQNTNEDQITQNQCDAEGAFIYNGVCIISESDCNGSEDCLCTFGGGNWENNTCNLNNSSNNNQSQTTCRTPDASGNLFTRSINESFCFDEDTRYTVTGIDSNSGFCTVSSQQDTTCANATFGLTLPQDTSLPQDVSATDAPTPEAIDLQSLDAGEYTIEVPGYETATITIVQDGVSVNLFEDTNANGVQDEGEDDIDADEFTVTVAKNRSLQRYDIQTGWNLVAFDFVDEEFNTASEIARAANERLVEVVQISKYDSGNWVHFVYRIDENGEEVTYGSDFTLVPGEGYFVRSLNSGRVTLKGNNFTSSVPISMQAGWNLISIQSQTNYTATEFLEFCNDEGIDCSEISRFELDGYESIVKRDGTFFGNDFNINSKEGYFVRNDSGESNFSP